MGLGLQRAALPEPLAHPAHRRHAKPQKFRDLSSALAFFIELQNALAHRNRYGSHEHTLPHTFPLCKATLFMEMLLSRKTKPTLTFFISSWKTTSSQRKSVSMNTRRTPKSCSPSLSRKVALSVWTPCARRLPASVMEAKKSTTSR